MSSRSTSSMMGDPSSDQAAGRARTRNLAWVLLGIGAAVAIGVAAGNWAARAHRSADRIAICTSLARILNAPGSTFQVSWTDASDRDGFVKVLYAVSPPGLKPRRRTLACRFAPQEGPFSPPQLAAVVSDGAAIGSARVGLFNRFWLNSREIAEPLPEGAPDLPPEIRPSDAA